MPLHPTDYLYRGQTRRYSPCQSSISRDINTSERSRLELVRRLAIARWFIKGLDQHPVFQWASSYGLHIDRLSIAQHYGVATGYIDLSEAIEVAVFFATCFFNGRSWMPATDGEGILYRIDWSSAPTSLSSRAEPISLQPFARPHQQWAWTLELGIGEDFEQLPGLEAAVFEHREDVGREMLRRFHDGADLYPHDPISSLAARARSARQIPVEFLRSAIADVKDRGDLSVDAAAEIALEAVAQQQLTADETPASLWNPEDLSEAQTAWQTELPEFVKRQWESLTVLLVKDPSSEIE
jgi:hypothetical protein